MKKVIIRSISLLLAVVVLGFSLSVSAVSEQATQEENISQDSLEYSYTLKPVYSDGTAKFVIKGDNSPDSAPIKVNDIECGYRVDFTIIIDPSSLKESYIGSLINVGLYEGSEPLVRSTDSDKISYTFRDIQSDKTLYIRVLNSSGQPLYFSGEDLSIRINLHVKNGFFDVVWGSILAFFGIHPSKTYEIWWNRPEE